MESVREITLGHELEQQIANTAAIVERGFPEGTIASVCWTCNQVQELTVEETAKMIAEGTWPKCCGKRTEMVEPDGVPPF